MSLPDLPELSPGHPKSPRLSSAERRKAIIEAAIGLFSERGFRGVTTRELAAAVGVTEPVLYQHFKTKSDLYRAMIEEQCAEDEAMGAGENEATDDRSFFLNLGKGILVWFLNDPRFPRLLLRSALDRHELTQLFYEAHVSRFYQMIAAHIAKQGAAGLFRDCDSELVARAFVGMFVHMGMIGSIYCPGLEFGERDQVATQIVDLFLNGIRARAEESKINEQ
jgi:AcrR family transcriptional regulator